MRCFLRLCLFVLFLISFKSNGQNNDSLSKLVMFGVNYSEEIFKELSNSGITHVHTYSLSTNYIDEPEKIQMYLSLAEKYKLKVLFDLNGAIRVKYNKLDELIDLVKRYNSSPVIDMWYLYDEPDNDNINNDTLERFYEKIKEVSDKPIVLTHAWTKNWYTYKQDVFMYDIYPIYDENYPSNGLLKFREFNKAVLKIYNKNEIIPIVQFFNWNSIDSAVLNKKKNIKVIGDLRFPNKKELYYFTFYPISKGIKSIGYYSLVRSRMSSKNWYKDIGLDVIKEASLFLEQVSVLTREEVSIFQSKNIDVTLWKDKEGFIKFAMFVNNNDSKQELESAFLIKMLKLDEGNASNKSLGAKIVLEPWDIVIYKL